LAPSDTAQLDRRLVLAFVTEVGGPTSHTAIMARSLGIPAVVGTGDVLARVREGMAAAIDGDAGSVVLGPDEAASRGFERRRQEATARREGLRRLRDLPAVTTDGRAIELAANVGHPREAAPALEYGPTGVGLYRTEFLFLDRDTLPDEDEQYEAYRAVAEAFGRYPVIIRTLDIGGDKEVPALGLPRESNPFLGWRALRISLQRRDLFETQLRAMWRAAAHGNILVMFPMVATIGEIRQAKAALRAAREGLVAEGKTVGAKLPAGIMVETPAAAVAADILAKEVDFFSLGTNDLIQYTLAVDRVNEKVAYLYDPFNPAVLRLIDKTVDAAHRAGIWCGMCGEMAGLAAAAPFLVGIGLDELSMSPPSVPLVKEAIRGMSAREAGRLARQALDCESGEEVRELLKSLPTGREG
jgi:phosphotransferase system enzyme I (PtsI)